LFDANGAPTQELQTLIRHKIALETGRYRPNQALMTEAAAAFTPAPR
jgi:hypothetical protein